MAQAGGQRTGNGSDEPAGFIDKIKARIHAERRKRAATKGPGGKGLLYALAPRSLVLVVFFLTSLAILFGSPEGKPISVSQLASLAAAGRVQTATFLDEDSQVVAKIISISDATTKAAADKTAPVAATDPHVDGVSDDAVTVRTAYPNNGSTTNSTIQLLQASGAKVTVDPQAGQARLASSPSSCCRSSTKRRSILSLAGNLLAEISLAKLAVSWTLLIGLPGLVLGASPLLVSDLDHTRVVQALGHVRALGPAEWRLACTVAAGPCGRGMVRWQAIVPTSRDQLLVAQCARGSAGLCGLS